MTIAPGITTGHWYQLADGRYFQVNTYIEKTNLVWIRFSDGTEESIKLEHWYEMEPMPLSTENGKASPFGIYYTKQQSTS